MDLRDGHGSPTVNTKLLPYHQGSATSLDSAPYGTEKILQRRRFRVKTVAYSCVVAIQAWFVYGYSIGYTSPILSDLDSANTTYASLHKSVYQDIFSVRSSSVLGGISKLILVRLTS